MAAFLKERWKRGTYLCVQLFGTKQLVVDFNGFQATVLEGQLPAKLATELEGKLPPCVTLDKDTGHSWYCQDTSDILTRDNADGTSEVSLDGWTLSIRKKGKPHGKSRINIPIKEFASQNTCSILEPLLSGINAFVDLSQAAFTPSETFGAEG
ncbi:hypothetical protein ARMGADRAFT_1061572 [Armillaria gallica]|uniref:Uncharacterized protein n=1 Tax=Armillaria gallica TaxID=47427 RepID=A0A2H3E590_ARMGA|nr:hypothetical protein ARMGADRAFT_1061572 [Armillaria gallica]